MSETTTNQLPMNPIPEESSFTEPIPADPIPEESSPTEPIPLDQRGGRRVRRLRVLVEAALCAVAAALIAFAATPRATAARPANVPATISSSGDGELTGTVNLNTATAEALRMLPGVGPTKADRIVAWRKKHGAFRRVDDLRRVKGFGPKTVDKLRRYLRVEGKSLRPRGERSESTLRRVLDLFG